MLVMLLVAFGMNSICVSYVSKARNLIPVIFGRLASVPAHDCQVFGQEGTLGIAVEIVAYAIPRSKYSLGDTRAQAEGGE